MPKPQKEVRPDAKLLNLPEEELEFLWNFRFKEDGKIRNKLTKVQAEVPLRYGFTISLSQLSYAFASLKATREWEESAAFAEQAKNDFLVRHPDASPEELLQVGQLHFTALSMRQSDSKGFVSLMKAITSRDRVKADREKAADARKTKVEAGLEALHEQIKGIPAAVKAFEQLKETLGQ